MKNKIEESPFIQMRKVFLKEKEELIEKYEVQIFHLQARVDVLEGEITRMKNL